MPGVDEIMEKVGRGEALSAEEKREVMSVPHGDVENVDESEDIARENEAAGDEKLLAAQGGPTPTEKANAEATEPAKPTETGTAAPAKGGDANTPQATKTGEQGQQPADTGKAKETPGASGITDAEAAKIKQQLDTPEAQLDTQGLSPAARGLLYDLRHVRQRAQRAEEERDTLKFQKLKAEQEKAKDTEPADEDFLNKKQVREQVETIALGLEAKHRAQLAGLWGREGTREHKDFGTVLDLGEALVKASEDHQAKIREAYEAGDNALLVAYDLIKSDPGFAKLIADAGLTFVDGVLSKPTAAPVEGGEKKGEASGQPTKPASPEAKKAAEKIAANAVKTPTTGAAGGGEAGSGGEGWTVERVQKLSDADFAKLPKSERDKILQLLG